MSRNSPITADGGMNFVFAKAMKEQNVYDEFEVTFNYKNVLYICQVRLMKEKQDDSYFNITYYSPNEKGDIQRLVAIPGKDGSEKTTWQEQDHKHDPEFLQALGAAIEKREL